MEKFYESKALDSMKAEEKARTYLKIIIGYNYSRFQNHVCKQCEEVVEEANKILKITA